MVVPIKLASKIRLTGCATGAADSSNGDTPRCGVPIVPLGANRRQISYHGPGREKPMKNNVDRFRVARGTRVDLTKWPTLAAPAYESDDHYAQLLKEYVGTINAQQQLLNASESFAVLVIFQAMDAGGKDSAIEHVMAGINPQGCRVTSFKAPSEQELKHDFLWRAVRELPERGRIGIFNRSYYEDVLIVRVHPEMLRNQGLPVPSRGDNEVWHERYRSIVGLERHVPANSTRLVNIFLP